MTDEDRVSIQQGLESLQNHGSFSMEDVLADFGLPADTETLPSRDREEAVAVPQ